METISVVVRFKNERRYLRHVLSAVRAQNISATIEIVGVDNGSTDGSRGIASQYVDTLVDITHYRPGIALNRGIDASTGDIVVLLSAHALPSTSRWLADLTKWSTDRDVLATYGAQVFVHDCQFGDRGDLHMFSDADPRAERHRALLWNANSCFRRKFWEQHPFDERTLELEDRLWAKELLPRTGQVVRYEPDAIVYHYEHLHRHEREYPHAAGSDRPDHAVAIAVQVLRQDNPPWVDVMTAGLALKSFADLPAARSAMNLIAAYLALHPDPDIRWRMADTLKRFRGSAATAALVAGIGDEDFFPRDQCAWSLTDHGAAWTAAANEAEQRLPSDYHPYLGFALARTGESKAVEQASRIMRNCIAGAAEEAARAALYFLGEVPWAAWGTSTGQEVRCRAANASPAVQRAALWCWGRLTEARMFPEPTDQSWVYDVLAVSDSSMVRAEAAAALGRMLAADRAETARIALAGASRHDLAGRVRFAAIQAQRLFDSGNNDVQAAEDDTDFGVRFERELRLERHI